MGIPIRFLRQTVQNQSGFSGEDIPESSIFQSCVRCGLCLPHCPTYLETLTETSSPRGRIHLIEAVAAGELGVTDPGFTRQMYQCLDCRACEAVCPSGVQYGQLVEAARTQIERARPLNPFRHALRQLIFQKLFGDMRVFRRFNRLLRLYQRSGLRFLARKTGILSLLRLAEMERLLPDLPASFLIPTNQEYPASPDLDAVQAPTRVSLFTGCIMSTAFAETDRATIRVLNRAGCTVALPETQGCCGALTIHAGAMDEARKLARQNIEAFEHNGANTIIVNAAGCGAALKEYAHLLKNDPEYAERAVVFSQRVRDWSEFLARRPLPTTQLRSKKRLKITYQEPCHLVHAQRIRQEPRQLLRALPGVELLEMQESALCCGSAGTYNVTQPAMSRTLRRRKIEHIIETGAEIVVTANPGCHLQLRAGLQEAGSKIQVMHILDLLDQFQN